MSKPPAGQYTTPNSRFQLDQFTGGRSKNLDNLKKAIETIKLTLPIAPQIFCADAATLGSLLRDQIANHSKFCFIDPFGYTGITRELIQMTLNDWGSDVVIFLHTSGINRNVEHQKNSKSIRALFGEEGYNKLLKEFQRRRKPGEMLILEKFRETCREVGAEYFVPLQFNFPKSRRISHHLVFLTRNPKAFKIMKDVMAKYSVSEDGIPKYVFIEGWEDAGDQQSFAFTGAMAKLKSDLLRRVSDGNLLVRDIVNAYHREGSLYLSINVARALWLLVEEGRIEHLCKPCRKKRKEALGDNCLVGPKWR